MPYKMERENFWSCPGHLITQNDLQGQLYDQINEDNIILLQDLQERAIDFLQQNVQGGIQHDFAHFLN